MPQSNTSQTPDLAQKPLAAELIEHEPVGGERKLRGKCLEIEIAYLIKVIAGPQTTTALFAPKPDSHGMASRVVNVGMDCVDSAYLHFKAGLFEKFAPRRVPNILRPLDVAARDAPLPTIGAGTAAEQDALLTEEDNGDPDDRVSIVYEAAAAADRPVYATPQLWSERAAAMRAEAETTVWRRHL